MSLGERKLAVIAVAAGVALLVPFPRAAAGAEDLAARAVRHSAALETALAAASPKQQPVILDRVVAAVNGDVILSSDVREEMRFARLQPGRGNPERNTPERALRRLIDRDLILQQMKIHGIQIARPADAQVEKQLAELRSQLPQCAQYHCETDAGWKAFLASDGLTEAAIRSRWRQRMTILAFIQSRFGAGVRISPEQIDDYYEKSFVPEFAKRKLPAPSLASVSQRIREVLLQERVNELLKEWLASLKQEGSVRILYPSGSSGAVQRTESAAESQP